MMRHQLYQWPGNIRELQNLLERIFNFLDEDIITLKHLPEKILECYQSTNSSQSAGFLRKIEAIQIIGALQRHHGNRSQTATDLGISRSTLYRKIQEYDIDTTVFEEQKLKKRAQHPAKIYRKDVGPSF